MMGISRVVNMVNTTSISGNEKNDQRRNNIKTGVAAAGITASAILASTVIKNAGTDGTRLFNATASVKDFAGRAASSIGKRASALIPDKLTQKLAELKTQITGSNAGLKIAEMAGKVAEKCKSELGDAKKYYSEMPTSVKVVAGVALGLLALTQIFKKGQINSAYSAQKQES